jgi:hypothetical protein
MHSIMSGAVWPTEQPLAYQAQKQHLKKKE